MELKSITPAGAAGELNLRIDLTSPKLNALSWKGKPMEVQLSPEKEARLHHFANRTGREPAQLIAEAVDRMLEYDARFIEAVEEGRAAARRGDLLEHAEVVARIEGMFQS
jgi:predicted transcriptional regulator